MKKVFAILLLSTIFVFSADLFGNSAFASAKTIVLTIGDEYMTVDGNRVKIDSQNSKPYIENDRTLVPMAGIFDALSASYSWDGESRTITAQKDDNLIHLRIGEPMVFRNSQIITLETAPVIRNDKTMVPLRFVSESLGAEVSWNSSAKTITIRFGNGNGGSIDPDAYISVGGAKVILGESSNDVLRTFGNPNRIDRESNGLEWYVYNGDYSNFIMIGMKDGRVHSIYSNARNFSTKDVRIGDYNPPQSQNAKYFVDGNDGNKVYACLLTSGSLGESNYDSSYLGNLEIQIFDMTNAYRTFHGLYAFAEESVARDTARKHSEDMAYYNYFGHTNLRGLSPFDRYYDNGGTNFASGENISGGREHAYDTLDGWINSSGHRENILSDHRTLGVGSAYRADSTYRFYSTQLFTH